MDVIAKNQCLLSIAAPCIPVIAHRYGSSKRVWKGLGLCKGGVDVYFRGNFLAEATWAEAAGTHSGGYAGTLARFKVTFQAAWQHRPRQSHPADLAGRPPPAGSTAKWNLPQLRNNCP
jgi:hypothetical protein